MNRQNMFGVFVLVVVTLGVVSFGVVLAATNAAGRQAEATLQTARAQATINVSYLTAQAVAQARTEVALRFATMGAARQIDAARATYSALASPTNTRTVPPSRTPFNTTTPQPTRTSPPTRTLTPTITQTPTETLTPLPTATPYTPTRTYTPSARAPRPADMIPTGDADLFNILLIGLDSPRKSGNYRTDTLVVVSINRTAGTVNMLSIPRDLWVYIPRVGYERINTASAVGDLRRWPGGGDALLAETLTYNLGIVIHRRVRVDFEGFKLLVDTLNGVDIVVDCPLVDWRVMPNGSVQRYTLPVGKHHMDGSLALWYARSRMTTSDFERARRQQNILRALWHNAKARGLLQTLPDVWDGLTQVVSTDLSLADVLSLVPLALDLQAAQVHHYLIGPNHVSDWTTPAGAEVLVPKSEAIRMLLVKFFSPPTANRLFAEAATVSVVNGTAIGDLGEVAAARLAGEGFSPVLAVPDSQQIKRTLIYDYTGGAKPNSSRALSRILGVAKSDVIAKPDPNAETDFMIVLGSNYRSCSYSPYQGMN
jgi:LCP family protein required for cell wall assembly